MSAPLETMKNIKQNGLADLSMKIENMDERIERFQERGSVLTVVPVGKLADSEQFINEQRALKDSDAITWSPRNILNLGASKVLEGVKNKVPHEKLSTFNKVNIPNLNPGTDFVKNIFSRLPKIQTNRLNKIFKNSGQEKQIKNICSQYVTAQAAQVLEKAGHGEEFADLSTKNYLVSPAGMLDRLLNIPEIRKQSFISKFS